MEPKKIELFILKKFLTSITNKVVQLNDTKKHIVQSLRQGSDDERIKKLQDDILRNS